MSNTTFNPRTVGALTTALEVNPLNIISKRNPTVHDNGILGQIWINTLTNSIFQLTSYTGGNAIWTSTPSSGMNPTFQTVTITGIMGTSLNVESGNTILGGNLTVDGTTTFNGPFVINDDTQIIIKSTYNGAGALQLLADGGVNETILIESQLGTDANSVNIVSSNGGITLNSPSFTGVGITLETGSGEVFLDAGGGLVLQSSEASSTAVTISAQDTTGGILISSGTSGVTCNSTGALSFNSSFSGPAILFTSSAGGMTFSSADRLEMTASTGAGDALTWSAPGSGGGIVVAVDTGGITMQAADGPVSITSGLGDITIGTDSTTGLISIGGTGSNTGDFDLAPGTGVQTINIATDPTSGKTVNIATGANSNNVVIGSVSGTGSARLLAGSSGISIASVGGTVSLGGSTGTSIGAASGNVTISAGNDISISAGGGPGVIIDSQTSISLDIEGDGSGNINIGGIDITTGIVNLGGTDAHTGNINIGPGVSPQTINIATDGTSAKTVNIATGANSNLVNIGSVLGTSAVFIGAGSGGIDLDANGNVEVPPATTSVASPAATATLNTRVGSVTFTGFTTAASASQQFTINNLLVTTTSALFVTVAHLNASTNGALLVVTDVTQNTGHILVTIQNLGTNPLGAGDNVLLNFWVLS
jgi:filamentous hemagglutinin